MRSYIYKIINTEIPQEQISQFGTPVYSAILSRELISDENETNVLSFVPFYDESLKITSSIMAFNGHVDGAEYFFVDKQTLLDTPIDLEEDPSVLNIGVIKEEFLPVFDLFDCYLNCQGAGISTRDIDCPSFGNKKNWWQRRWISIINFFRGIRGGNGNPGIFYPCNFRWNNRHPSKTS